MKLGVIPENIIEWFALAIGRVPTPIIETHISCFLARAILVATKLNSYTKSGLGWVK